MIRPGGEATMKRIERMVPTVERLAQQDLLLQQLLAAKEDPTVIRATGDQTIVAKKSFKAAPLRITDADGTLLHAFGTKS